MRRRWHAPAFKAAGLDHIRVHDLRHSAATLAIAAGESVLYLPSQLGHTDIRTTMRYAHADHQAMSAAAERVDGFF